MKILLLGLPLLLTGCGIQLPTSKGDAEFYPDGKPKSVSYESTKSQAGFSAELNPETGQMSVNTDNADSPRGFEDYVQAQMQIELRRLELMQQMFKAAIEKAP